MKINVLLTGQVRDEQVFSVLVEGLRAAESKLSQVVVSTWLEDIPHMKALGSDALEPTYVETMPPAYLSVINNRDVGSYLAQRAQIITGLKAFSESAHTVRLRADHNFGSPENIGRYLDLLSAAWSSPFFEDRSLVSGVDDSCPYFFEDRVLALCPRHIERFVSASIADTNSVDYFNIFPEYQFYKSLIQPKSSPFERHDHRFRLRTGCGDDFSAYDYEVLGKAYRQYVIDYMGEVSANVAFLHDTAKIGGIEAEYQSLCELIVVPRNFRIDSYDEYWAHWKRRSDRYELDVRFSEANVNVINDKQRFNALYLKYFSGNHRAVINMEMDEGPCTMAMTELKAVSYIHCGEREAGIREMLSVVENGGRGFEVLFYLLRELSLDGDIERFEEIAAIAAAQFSHETRMGEHIEAMRQNFKKSKVRKK